MGPFRTQPTFHCLWSISLVLYSSDDGPQPPFLGLAVLVALVLS